MGFKTNLGLAALFYHNPESSIQIITKIFVEQATPGLLNIFIYYKVTLNLSNKLVGPFYFKFKF